MTVKREWFCPFHGGDTIRCSGGCPTPPPEPTGFKQATAADYARWIEQADAIAAAEERGRRRGVEEAARDAETYCPLNASIYSRALASQIAVHIRGRSLASRDSAPQFSMPECPGPDCRACNGQACDLCGAGKTGFQGRCNHDVIERHQAPRDSGKEG